MIIYIYIYIFTEYDRNTTDTFNCYEYDANEFWKVVIVAPSS